MSILTRYFVHVTTLLTRLFRLVTLRSPLNPLLVLLLSLLLISCVETPTEPKPSNPIDANNPETGGDPYKLQAEIADGGVYAWQFIDALLWGGGKRSISGQTYSIIENDKVMVGVSFDLSRKSGTRRAK